MDIRSSVSVRVANESHSYGRRRCRRIEFEPHSVLIVDAYLSFVGAFELFIFQTFPVPQGKFGRCAFNHQQLVPARFDNRNGQPKLVSLGRPYEGEARISELDLHTVDNMNSPVLIVNRQIVTICQYEGNA
jgi:hypothetical protein